MAAVTICSDFGDKIYKGDWNVKVGSQEIPGVTGKFGLRVQNEAGQRLIQFSARPHIYYSETNMKHNIYRRMARAGHTCPKAKGYY